MVNDFLLRIGDNNHFNNSSKKFIWGINSANIDAKWFINTVKAGDRLWFVKSKSKGKIVAVATFVQFKERVLGPLLQLTESNDELGWNEKKGEWDTEVHFKDLFNLSTCDLLTEIKSPKVIRLYNENKCKVNLPQEYQYILRYSKMTRTM